jgi:RNA polymerase sigma-70 factor (TIGR02943 family)
MDVTTENPKMLLENWVNQFSDELYCWAFYKTSSKETAEDLVQETFLSAFHKINTFQGNSQPKTWLFSILNNKVIDYYRKSAKTTKKTFSLTENSGVNLSEDLFNTYGSWNSYDVKAIWEQEEELLDNPEFNLVMQECMNDLPHKWKLALVSKYLSEKDTTEICQELEITPSNYWQIVHRSKLLLRKCLEMKWA